MVTILTILLFVLAVIILAPIILVALDVLAIPVVILGKEIVLVVIIGAILYFYLKRKGIK